MIAETQKKDIKGGTMSSSAYKLVILWSFIYIASGLVVDYIVTKLGLYESKDNMGTIVAMIHNAIIIIPTIFIVLYKFVKAIMNE